MRNDIPPRRRIVVGIDGSPASMIALAWAGGEARLRQAELHAVCAWEDVERYRAPYAGHRSLPSRQESRAAADSLLGTSVRAAFGQAPPHRMRAEVAEGRPERVLLKCAVGAELLVLGCTRRVGYLPTVGPVQRACLRRASCPVVFVGPHETDRGSAGSPSASLRERVIV